jgi:Xaa-Pro aminopeptidase
MVFAVEIVLDFPGVEGYHVEDPILITPEGNRRLVELPGDRLTLGGWINVESNSASDC